MPELDCVIQIFYPERYSDPQFHSQWNRYPCADGGRGFRDEPETAFTVSSDKEKCPSEKFCAEIFILEEEVLGKEEEVVKNVENSKESRRKLKRKDTDH